MIHDFASSIAHFCHQDILVKGRLHYGGEHLLDANVDIDVFAKKTQKISVLAKVNRQTIQKGFNLTSVIEVNSRGQQLKVDLKSHLAVSDRAFGFGEVLSYTDVNQKPRSTGILFSVDPSQAHLLVSSPSKELLRVDAKLQLQKSLQKLDAEITVVGKKPTIINAETNDWNSFKFVEYQQGELRLMKDLVVFRKMTVFFKYIPRLLHDICSVA